MRLGNFRSAYSEFKCRIVAQHDFVTFCSQLIRNANRSTTAGECLAGAVETVCPNLPESNPNQTSDFQQSTAKPRIGTDPIQRIISVTLDSPWVARFASNLRSP